MPDVEDCLLLDALERYGIEAAIDPVFLLGSPLWRFTDDKRCRCGCNGKTASRVRLSVYERRTVLMPTIAVRGHRRACEVRFTMASSCSGV